MAFKNVSIIAYAVMAVFIGAANVWAEKITDFALLGADPGDSITVDNLTVTGGLIGSNSQGAVSLSSNNQVAGIRSAGGVTVFSGGNVSISGDIRADGNVQIGTSSVLGNIDSGGSAYIDKSTVTGTVRAAGGISQFGRFTVNGDVFGGANPFSLFAPDLVTGNVTVGGPANLFSGDINGNLIAGGPVSNGGATVGGTITQNAAVAPLPTNVFTPVPMPNAASFAFGNQDVTLPSGGSVALSPGAYRDLSVAFNTTITLTSGTYYFRNFEPSLLGGSSAGLLKLDLSNGPINIFVAGQFTDVGSQFAVKEPGSSVFADPFANGAPQSLLAQAGNVYFEVQQANSNAVFVESGTNIFGTVYAPRGGMFFSGPDNVVGALISNGPGGIAGGNLTVNFVPSNYLANVPEPATLRMGISGFIAVLLSVRTANRRRW